MITNGRTTMGDREQRDQRTPHEVEETILCELRGIRFGSLEIVIHDSKVVQIERKEKIRFNNERSKFAK